MLLELLNKRQKKTFSMLLQVYRLFCAVCVVVLTASMFSACKEKAQVKLEPVVVYFAKGFEDSKVDVVYGDRKYFHGAITTDHATGTAGEIVIPRSPNKLRILVSMPGAPNAVDLIVMPQMPGVLVVSRGTDARGKPMLSYVTQAERPIESFRPNE